MSTRQSQIKMSFSNPHITSYSNLNNVAEEPRSQHWESMRTGSNLMNRPNKVKKSLHWGGLMGKPNSNELIIDEIPKSSNQLISEKITAVEYKILGTDFIKKIGLTKCEPFEILVINDPRNEIYTVEIHDMWNYFRLTDQTSLKKYPDVNHIKMPKASIIEKYLDEYNQLKPIFISFLNLIDARLTFIFNDPHKDDFQLIKHNKEIYVVKLTSLATKTDHFKDLAQEESHDLNLPLGHKIVVNLDICESTPNEKEIVTQTKETKNINKNKCIIL